MVTIYGIPNCDTMKKARAWLTENGVEHAFHDYRKDGAPRGKLKAWAKAVGWEKLLNRAGTTFRKLPEDIKKNINEAKAFDLMVDHPAMIKRPVLEADGQILVGFRPEAYESVFEVR